MGKRERQEPEPEPRPKAYIEFGEDRVELEHDKTSVYIHGEEYRDYDHIFVASDATGEEEEGGLIFFREVVANFDQLAAGLKRLGYIFITKGAVTEADKELYRAYFDRDPLLPIKTYELNPRHEELIKKFGELIIAMPADLLYSEVTDEHNRPHPERWTD